MSLAHLPSVPMLSGHGNHRGGTPAEIRRENERLRGCDEQLVAATAENEALKARVKELGDQVVRQSADLARLRHALIQARPKVYQVPTRLDRPYAPAAVQLPYPVPVAGRDTSNDTTQPLPILDRPHAA